MKKNFYNFLQIFLAVSAAAAIFIFAASIVRSSHFGPPCWNGYCVSATASHSGSGPTYTGSVLVTQPIPQNQGLICPKVGARWVSPSLGTLELSIPSSTPSPCSDVTNSVSSTFSFPGVVAGDNFYEGGATLWIWSSAISDFIVLSTTNTSQFTWNIPPPLPTITSFTAETASIPASTNITVPINTDVTFRWSSNGTSCSSSGDLGPGSGLLPSGSFVKNSGPTPGGPFTQTLVCSNSAGSSSIWTVQVTVSVVLPSVPGTPSVSPNPSNLGQGLLATWGASTGDVVQYHIEGDVGGVCNSPFCRQVGSLTGLNVGSAGTVGSHWVRVRACNSLGTGPIPIPPNACSGWSAQTFFTVNNISPPSIPGAPSTSPNPSTTNDQLTFSWTASTDAVSYYIDTDSGTCFSDGCTSGTTSFSWPASNFGLGSHWVRIKAWNALGVSSYSPKTNFTVNTSVPITAPVLSICIGANCVPKSVYTTDEIATISWTTPPSTAKFILYLKGGAGIYAGCPPLPGAGCDTQSTGATGKVGDVFTVGLKRYIEVKACDALGTCALSNRITFDVSAPAQNISYTALQTPFLSPIASMGVADVWIEGEAQHFENGTWVRDKPCPAGYIQPFLLYGGISHLSGFNTFGTCLKYRNNLSEEGIQEVVVIGEYGRADGLRNCPVGTALHSRGASSMFGEAVGTCIRKGATNVIQDVAQVGGGQNYTESCPANAPNSSFTSELKGNGMKTCVLPALPAFACPDKPVTMPVICGNNSLIDPTLSGGEIDPTNSGGSGASASGTWIPFNGLGNYAGQYCPEGQVITSLGIFPLAPGQEEPPFYQMYCAPFFGTNVDFTGGTWTQFDGGERGCPSGQVLTGMGIFPISSGTEETPIVQGYCRGNFQTSDGQWLPLSGGVLQMSCPAGQVATGFGYFPLFPGVEEVSLPQVYCQSATYIPSSSNPSCKIVGYSSPTPTSFPDGSSIIYHPEPAPGYVERSGGACFTPPNLTAKARFKVVDPANRHIGGARLNFGLNSTETNYITNAGAVEGGFNLVIGPLPVSIPFAHFDGVFFRANGYYTDVGRPVDIIANTENDYTFVLTPLAFDYIIAVQNVRITRGATGFYETSGNASGNFKLAPGILTSSAQEVNISLSSPPSNMTLAIYGDALSPKTKCLPNPVCTGFVQIRTNKNTPLGLHTITLFGTTAGGVNRQTTFTIEVVDSSTSGYTLSVVKDGTGTGLVASAPYGIACGVRCSANFPSASTVTLTASEGPGSRFAGWNGTCDSISGLEGLQCTVVINSSRTVRATFNSGTRTIGPPLGYRLTVGVVGNGRVVAVNPPGINCGNNCAADFASGTVVELTASPQGPNSVFQSWSPSCDSPSGTTCRMTMNSSKKVRAIFSLSIVPPAGYYRLTLGTEGNGYIYAENFPPGTIIYGPDLPGGTVTYPTGDAKNVLVCGTTCVVDIKSSQSVNLSAFAYAYAVFQSWEGCDSSSGTNCSVIMNSSKTVVALFNSGPPPPASNPYQYKLTINKAGGGTGTAVTTGLSCNESCLTTNANFTTSAVVSATAGSNSSFAGWLGCDSTSGNNCTVASWLSTGAITPFGDTTIAPTIAPILSATPSRTVYNTEDVATTVWNQPSGTTFFRILMGGGVRDYTFCEIEPGCFSNNNLGSMDRVGNIFSVGSGRFIQVRACNNAGCSLPSNRLTFDVLGTNTAGYERTITAIFNSIVPPPPTSYSVTVIKGGNGTVTSPVGISCGVSCSVANLVSGTQAVLTAAPAVGASFAGWGAGDCDSTGGANGEVCTINIVSSSRVVTASFSSVLPPPAGSYNLVVTKEGTGTGIVISDKGGIVCGTGDNCWTDFPSGEVVKLTPSADSGSSFSSWINCPDANTLTGVCTVTMNSSRIVTAIFNDIPLPPPGSFNLTINKTGPGVVTSNVGGIACGVTCVQPFTSGTLVILTAAPNLGANFAGWTTGDCDVVSSLICQVTVNSTRTVNALFTVAGLPIPQWIEIHPQNIPQAQ